MKAMKRLEAWMAARLGHCARCMSLTAGLAVACWGGLALLMQAAQPSVGALIVATLVATGVSLGGVAHAAAYIARRVPGLRTGAAPSAAPQPMPGATRDCGCRSSSPVARMQQVEPRAEGTRKRLQRHFT